MSKLASLLRKEPLTLIVRLPENSMEMAKAAEEGGAHAIVLSFDAGQKDKKDIVPIAKSVKIPVGIKLEDSVGEQELSGFIRLGIDFVDLPLTGAQKELFKKANIGRILALGPDYSTIDLTRMPEKPIEGVDAAIIMKEEWGMDLTVGDLQQYITIAMSTTLPVIVPAQKSIKASEVPIIWDTGAKGVMIGDIVTGYTAASLKAVTREFRSAVEAVKE
ncbi:MAG: hypothetical protein ABH860_00465 [bacterium]